MLITCIGIMGDFALMLTLIMIGFALVFNVLQTGGADADDADGDPLSLNAQLYNMYNLMLLGDFDAPDYAASPASVVFFILVTLLVNVVMLNVLIAIVCEGFSASISRS